MKTKFSIYILGKFFFDPLEQNKIRYTYLRKIKKKIVVTILIK